MTPLTNLNQLKVGTKLRIVAKSERDCYGSVSVKRLIQMYEYLGPTTRGPLIDTEILINKSKNYFFSFETYLNGKSNWVKEVYVLDGNDKRLKNAKEQDGI